MVRALIAIVLVAGCGARVSSEPEERVPADALAIDEGPSFRVDSYIPPEPDTGAAWDTSAGDAPPTNAGCIACNNRNCSDSDCSRDPICNKQSFCRQACIDEVCAQRCRELYPSPLYDVWYQCLREKCPAECGL